MTYKVFMLFKLVRFGKCEPLPRKSEILLHNKNMWRLVFVHE